MFGKTDGSGGKDLAKAATANAPTISTASKLEGKSFAIMMIDLDIPTETAGKTNTLLHWMQTGLTAAASGAGSALTVKAAAPYLGPSPPAKTPLKHRYTEILVDTSAATPDQLKVLTDAAANRQGFQAEAVLTKAKLQDKVVAGNFFTVTNAGPAADAVKGGAKANSTTPGAAKGTGSATKPGKQTGLPVKGEAWSHQASGMLTGITVVAAVFFAL
ncbi:Protein FLOWERING LOCUS T [Apiospora marii]|uniref:Protein FLOWERING LOCUS T n=1 Tax=Apiospora marii TaxID=335849 RepID=A0ABR1R6Q3_9PEZI